MGEIVLPVRVMGYPDNDGTEHDSFYIQDADGRHWVWLVRRDDADEIAAALNDHSALQAQVAALEAERDRLQERVAIVRRFLRAGDAAGKAGGMVLFPRTIVDGKAAPKQPEIEDEYRVAYQTVQSVVGDGDEKEGASNGAST